MKKDYKNFNTTSCMLCGEKGLSFVNNLRDDDEHWAARCNTCGHVQTTPLPTIDEDEKLYQDNMFRRLISKSEMDDILLMQKYEPYADKQVNIIKNRLPKDKTILEIGSGYGWFIEKIRAEGYVAEGIELSDEKCEMALKRANIQLHNINILRDGSQDIGKFDAVCMFQVLEHIAEPVEFLKRASQFLKKNGCVVIEVPNFNAYMKQYSKEYNDFSYFRCHLSYFTPETLTKVLDMAGFTNIRILGDQLYSVENAIHWIRNKEPFKPYCQVEMPDGLEFVNKFYQQQMEENLTSDCLVAIGEIL